MGLAIVVLAAGLGTRYGGLKQLAPLGPSGEALLDYTLHDAAAAGFSEAVLVVAPGIVDAMTAHLVRFVPPVAVRLVVQEALASRQARPWGTAHATMVGARGLTGPFAVANADDAYGSDAIATIAAHLRAHAARSGTHTAAVVGYAAGATLTASGGVSRAVCRVDDRGHLISIVEHTGVRREAGRVISDTATLDETTLISMNLWGFGPTFVETLGPIVGDFVARHRDDDRELRLPDVVGELTAHAELDVSVLPTTSRWLGVTHNGDALFVREQLAALTAAGAYPSLATPGGSRP
jgi:CTP:molybdopterin cytidylyltransferase MocA